MIIFGTGSSNLKTNNTKSYDCGNCETQNTVNFSFWAKYFHIFWIPVFPYSKKGISQCRNCKQALYFNEMPQKMKDDYNAASAEVKSPFTHYIGLMIIGIAALFIIGTIITSK